MSGMDRLTDGDLESLVSGRSTESVLGCGCEVVLAPLARELLDQRRASQAAPAPSDHAISKKWAERMLPVDEGVTPSAGAPAPSAGCEWCVDGVQADGETPCPCTETPIDLKKAEDKAFNEALEKAIGIARRCGAFATARDIRKLIRTVEE